MVSGSFDFRKTGMLIMQRQGERGALDETQTSMDQCNLSYTLLTPSELTENYPHITYTGNDKYRALLDADAGLLLPSRCLNAVQVTQAYDGI